MAGSTGADDPAKWSVDGVIYELCYNQNPVWTDTGVPSLNDSVQVEEVLRENDITGDVLLDLSENELKTELGIASLGQRRRLTNIIACLRDLSPLFAKQQQAKAFRLARNVDGTTVSRRGSSAAQLTPTIENATHRHGFIPGNETPAVSHSALVNRISQSTGGHQPLARIKSSRSEYSDTIARDGTTGPDLLDSLDENITAQQEAGATEALPTQQSSNGHPESTRKRQLDHQVEGRNPKRHQHLSQFGLVNTSAVAQLSEDTELVRILQSGPESSPHVGQKTTKRIVPVAVPPLPSSRTTFVPATGPDDQTIPSTTSHPTIQSLDEANSERTSAFADLLAAYPVSETDEVLPLYGESDEDDRYFTEDSDSSELESHLLQKQATGLSKPQIDAVIDDALQEFALDWTQRKLVRAQGQAYQKWKIAATLPALKERMLRAARKDKELAVKRVPRIRESIQSSTWSKIEEIRQQCESLQATVDQIQESDYIIGVLEGEHEPLNPPRPTGKHLRPPRKSGADGDIECESDDDSLINFDDDAANDFVAHDDDWVQDSTATDVSLSRSTSPQMSGSASRSFSPSETAAPATALPAQQQQTVGDVDVVVDDALPALAPNPEMDAMNAMEGVEFSELQTQKRRRSSNGYTADADEDERDAPYRDTIKPISTIKKGVQTTSKRIGLDVPVLSDGSDSDAPVRPYRRSQYAKHGYTSDRPITIESPSKSGNISDSDFAIRTPELNPVDASEASKSDGKKDIHGFEGREEDVSNLLDFTLVKGMSWTKVVERYKGRHSMGLCKAVSDLSTNEAQNVLSLAKVTRQYEIENMLRAGINYYKSEDETIINVPKHRRESTKRLTRLYYSYCCVKKFIEAKVSDEELDVLWNMPKKHIAMFQGMLVQLLTESLKLAQEQLPPPSEPLMDQDTISDTDLEPLELELERDNNIARHRNEESERASSDTRRDSNPEPTSTRLQRQARQRVVQQQTRKEILTQKLAKVNQGGNQQTKVPVNFQDPIVFLDDHIGQRIKPHQISGLQFLWRELIDDEQHEGCLLAHTMGLGKTMQVISFLVTVAQCNQSPDPQIRAHIPSFMRDLRVLILCPASLAENWYDELLYWMPAHDTLGTIVKVSGHNDKPFDSISFWAENGGVLILSYNRLHLYIKNPGDNGQDGHQQSTQHDKMTQWLTELPKIVVADEAHMLKNPNSKMSKSAMRLETKSRIALTGSPLSNHIEEYWAMINFIAPNYLSDLPSFRRKFVSPINASLAVDSKPYERRVGLKKMHVLRKILDPKVNRADIAAIRSDLPSKTEFFITVPLTDLQKRAYQIFVSHCRKAAADDFGKARTTKLFHWVSILTLLCNHPHAFVSKLQNAEKQQTGDYASTGTYRYADDDDSEGNTAAATDVDITDKPAIVTGMDQATEVFKDLRASGGLDDVSLSYRALLISLIVTETMKLGEKVLIFSHSLPTLDYLSVLLDKLGCFFERIDGDMAAYKRQQASKEFNSSQSDTQAIIISTRAGGLGLNLQGATRVIIVDYGFNPSWEEQAIGRAYRIGQKQPVYVYRFRIGGTFEEVTFNSAVFKTQLFTRVIDHRAIQRKASKADAANYFFDPIDPPLHDFGECKGKDPHVLDKVMAKVDCIRNIELTETFAQEIIEDLTEQEIKEVDQDFELEQLQRRDPSAYQTKVITRKVQETMDVSSVPVTEIPDGRSLKEAVNGPISLVALTKITQHGASGSSISKSTGKPDATNKLSTSFDDSNLESSLSKNAGTATLSQSGRPKSVPRNMDGPNDGPVEHYEVRNLQRQKNEGDKARGCTTH